MNHPLPQNSSPIEYSFVDAEEPDAAPPAAPIAFHTRPRRNAELIAAVTASSNSDDPYEQYRQRIMQDHRVQHGAELQGVDSAPPTRSDFHSAALRYQSYFKSVQRYEPIGYAEYDEAEDAAPRWRLSRSIVMAGCAAIIAGGALGYAVANLDRIGQTTGQALAFVGSILPAGEAQAKIQPATAAEPDAMTVISKKPISTASLDVADVTGALNTPIPLAMRTGGMPESADVGIRLTGLPPQASLSAGTRVSDNAWLLRHGEETGVMLTVPSSDKPRLALEVAAIEMKTGELAAPIREMNVALTDPQVTAQTSQPKTQVEVVAVAALPAAQAPAATQPAAIPQPVTATPAKPVISAEASGLLQKGDVLLKSGDLVAARQFYMRAFEMGAGAGAYGAARTYDPAVYKEMNVQGLMPDPAEARVWYGKAAQAGIAEAAAAMAALPADLAAQ